MTKETATAMAIQAADGILGKPPIYGEEDSGLVSALKERVKAAILLIDDEAAVNDLAILLDSASVYIEAQRSKLVEAERRVREWRDECAKLHAQMDSRCTLDRLVVYKLNEGIKGIAQDVDHRFLMVAATGDPEIYTGLTVGQAKEALRAALGGS